MHNIDVPNISLSEIVGIWPGEGQISVSLKRKELFQYHPQNMCISNWNVVMIDSLLILRIYFKLSSFCKDIANKNQLPGLFISRTLVKNGLNNSSIISPHVLGCPY